MSKVAILSGLSLFGALGCTRHVVRASDLPGAWVLSDASRPSLPPAFRDASATIVLDEDGRFSASDVPGEMLFVRPNGRDRLVTGRGFWRLDLKTGMQVLQLDFHAIEGALSKVPYGTQLHISAEASGLTLFYFQGDPDAGKRVIFERRKQLAFETRRRP
jgi:hypothetical protein